MGNWLPDVGIQLSVGFGSTASLMLTSALHVVSGTQGGPPRHTAGWQTSLGPGERVPESSLDVVDGGPVLAALGEVGEADYRLGACVCGSEAHSEGVLVLGFGLMHCSYPSQIRMMPANSPCA